MKAERILRFGPPSVITNDNLRRPEPAAGQLLVRVKDEILPAAAAYPVIDGALAQYKKKHGRGSSH